MLITDSRIKLNYSIMTNSKDEVAQYINEEVLNENEVKYDYPKKYKVIIHNDNYTSMEFVVEILINIFKKNHDEAYKTMLKTHYTGSSVAGIYFKEVAEIKKKQAKELAKQFNFPLYLNLIPE